MTGHQSPPQAGPRCGACLLGLLVLASGLAFPGRAAAQFAPGGRVEDRLTRYGGYLPYGGYGYPADSGAPLGGYTPFAVGGPEAGWLELNYGFGSDDFANSYDFGSDVPGGPNRNNTTGFERRPPERGRGIWDGYGRADVNPPPVWPHPGGR